MKAPLEQAWCPRCKTMGTATRTAVCLVCWNALHEMAKTWQESDYLCRYLSTRVDKDGKLCEDREGTLYQRQLASLYGQVAQARVLGLDWMHPPQPMHFSKRMEYLFAPYGKPPNRTGAESEKGSRVGGHGVGGHGVGGHGVGGH